MNYIETEEIVSVTVPVTTSPYSLKKMLEDATGIQLSNGFKQEYFSKEEKAVTFFKKSFPLENLFKEQPCLKQLF